MVGEPLPADSIQFLRQKMPAYGLITTQLTVKQGSFKDTEVDVNAITSTVTDQVIKFSQNSISRKDQTIDSLRRAITKLSINHVPVAKLNQEISILMPDIERFTAASTQIIRKDRTKADTLLLVYAKTRRKHTRTERKRIEKWLLTRTNSRQIKLILE